MAISLNAEKGIGIVTILLGAVIGAALPLCFQRSPRGLILADAFAGGVFLSVALVHMVRIGRATPRRLGGQGAFTVFPAFEAVGPDALPLLKDQATGLRAWPPALSDPDLDAVDGGHRGH